MIRVIFLIFSMFSFMFAVEKFDFSECQKLLSKSIVESGKYSLIAIETNKFLLFSDTNPPFPVIKSDPFTGLYLVKFNAESTPLEYRDSDQFSLDYPMASITKKMHTSGNFTKRQSDLREYAKLDTNTSKNSIIAAICYHSYGLGVGSGNFIESKYILHFLNSKDKPIYGDIGIRVNSSLIVERIDPFFKNVGFKKGDKIVKIAGNAINSKSDFSNRVLFGKIGEEIEIEVLRNGKSVKFKTKIAKRHGGGYVSDTFMERFGLYFAGNSNKLSNIDSNSKFYKAGLRKGDKILAINDVKIHTPKDIEKLANKIDSNEAMKILIDRNDFQFFINMNFNGDKNGNYKLLQE